MSTRIMLKKATRIEGNADIHLEIEAGHVKAARFMVQDFRGFEKLVVGKRADSAPHLVSRICGLCSMAHQVAGFRAVEEALGMSAPSAVDKLRQVAVWGEWISSHALSFFFLALPDSLEAVGSIFDLLRLSPDIADDAFRLRRAGNRIVEIVGKRAVHAIALGIGGFREGYSQDDLNEIRQLANQAKTISKKLIDQLDSQPPQAQLSFPADNEINFLTYIDQLDKSLFKVFDRRGQLIDEFEREIFSEHVSEMHVDWSLAKFPYLTQRGFPDGMLMVGPLARLFRQGSVRQDADLAELKLTQTLNEAAGLSLDHLDICRLLEIYWAAKKILDYVDEIDLSLLEPTEVDLEKSGTGIGVVEAPRGVLIHEYMLNRGVVERMQLLVATQFNNAYINLVLRDVAERHVQGDHLSELGEELIARCVRTFDPCLTCATH